MKKYFTKIIEGKLSLCSREIKYESEKYYYKKYIEQGKHIIYETDEAVDCVEWDGENVDESDLFYVVGIISPLAVFASEGMELSEDDVQASHEYKDGVISKWDRDEILCYKIKCPTCNVYH